jgi:hypothetical protein
VPSKSPLSLASTTSILARVEIAAPHRSGALRVWPLVASDPVAPPVGVAHVALAAALAAGAARIEVPNRRGYRALRADVENDGDVALLLLAGESPLAERPRWRIAATTLVAPRTRTEILVRNAPHDDARIATIVRSAGAPFLEAQLGFVAALGDAVVGLEVVGRADVFAHAQPALLAPYARAAAAPALLQGFETTPPESPEALIEAAMAADCIEEPAFGLGEALRLHGRGVVGRGLAHGDVLHLSVRWLGDDGEPLVKFP